MQNALNQVHFTAFCIQNAVVARRAWWHPLRPVGHPQVQQADLGELVGQHEHRIAEGQLGEVQRTVGVRHSGVEDHPGRILGGWRSSG